MKEVLWISAGVFLLDCTYSDLRSGRISLRVCLLFSGAGVVARALAAQSMRACIGGIACSVVPGMLLMGLAAGSREQIGRGDAWMLITLGILTGAEACMRMGTIALGAAFFHAVLHCAVFREKRAREIPFAPDLLIAYLLLSGIGLA